MKYLFCTAAVYTCCKLLYILYCIRYSVCTIHAHVQYMYSMCNIYSTAILLCTVQYNNIQYVQYLILRSAVCI